MKPHYKFRVDAWLIAVVLLAAGVSAASSHAQTASTPAELGPGWSSLSAAQRSALAPLQTEWSALDGGRKQKWLELASRFPAMSADERSRVQVRM